MPSPRPSPAPRPIVVKLGGSLGEGAGARERLAGLLAAVAAAPHPVVIVPGGGPLAEGVRIAQADLGFSDALAHRLAIAAMAGFARILAEIEPRLFVVGGAAEARAALAAGRTPVWTAAEVVDRPAAVEESWRYTSDSLAAVLAASLDAERLLVLKSATVPAGRATAAALAATGLVDAAFAEATGRFAGVVRIIGPDGHGRLAAAIAGAAVGLAVTGGGAGEAETATE